MVPRPNNVDQPENAIAFAHHILPKVEKYEWRLSPELEAIARDELKETPENRSRGLAKLRQRLVDRSDLVCRTDDLFLLRFLRSQKFDVDKSMKVLERYIQMRDQNPEWFKKLDPTRSKIAELAESGFVLVLPKRDNKGRRVVVNNSNLLDLARHTSADIMQVFMATFETLMADEENMIRGLTYVFYAKGITLAHVQIWTPSEAAKIFGTCEKNLAIRHRDINLVHLPFAVWAVVEFVKSLLSSKIRHRISTHSDEMKVVKKLGLDILPVELGGQAELPMMAMAKLWSHELVANRDHLLGLDHISMLASIESNLDFEAPKATSYWSYFTGSKA